MRDNKTDNEFVSLIKNLVVFSSGTVMTAFLGFISVPLIAHFVVPSELGLSSMYTLALNLSSLVILLGMDQSFVREFNTSDTRYLLGTSVAMPLFNSLVLALVLISFRDRLSLWLFDEPRGELIFLIAVSLPVNVVIRFSQLIVRMREKAKLYSFLIVTQRFLYLIALVILFLLYEKTFRAIAYALFFGSVATAFISFGITSGDWKTVFRVDRNRFLKMLSFGLPLVPAALSAWLMNSADKIALRAWSDFTNLGVYAFAVKIVAIIELLKGSFVSFWIPTAYKWRERNVDESRFVFVSELVTIVMTLAFVVLVILRGPILSLFSESYAGALALIPFLAFVPIMYTISETTVLGIQFSRKTVYTLIISVAVTAINMSGNFIMVPRFGALGASIATGASYVVFFWLRTAISRKLWFPFPVVVQTLNILFMIVLSIMTLFTDRVWLLSLSLLVFAALNAKKISSMVATLRKRARQEES